MATLVLQAAGQALGTALGGPIGGIIGQAVGATAGQAIDQALIARATPARRAAGPRLKDLDVQASSEGAPIPRLYGRARISGQLIWATRFEEQVSTSTQSSGGKLGGGGKTRVTTYSYFANFAVGLAEGPITRIGRVWADGRLIDLAGVTYRVYPGSETQAPDPLISAKEGTGNVPAYRGLAYVVFERLALEPFGNRLPQLAFEVFRAIDDVETRIHAVTIIPGASEFGYDTVPVTRAPLPGRTEPENQHGGRGDTDWTVAVDDLTATCPNVSSVALVVSWFGTDLRAGQCQIRPGVEVSDKVTSGGVWQVGGLARAQAHVVSTVDGKPAFGGTPSDASVIAAIQDLNARDRKVVFYPFVMMDVPADNSLTDPYTGAVSQLAYPWRGRITVDPAPGTVGTVDKTPTAAAQIAAFFGAAASGDFTPAGQTITYSGPAEWGYRRMVLHYARLCVLAGGVDAFLIGSEFKGLTSVRDSAEHYPAVDALVALAAEVRQVLGAQTRISYAADWSEYFGHQPADGSGDVFFNLDPLWASADIDFIGIDNYMPLADWRDGEGHADMLAGARAVYDLDYLRGNIAAGEGFDWFYANEADRQTQTRTPITDGAHNKPWVFRFKDLKSWWENPHFNRPGGAEAAVPTVWQPRSKPIWFTETGCPAIDKGANQPNVFFDAKSSESALPHFSSGARDDLMQRRFIDAVTSYWDLDHPDHVAGANPVSPIYGGAMVDPQRIHIWTWDARPFPLFPFLPSVWSDGANWQRGHWITGRMGSAPLDRLVAEILSDHGFDRADTSALYGTVDGFVIDRPMSARDALDPLELAFFFDAVERGEQIVFAHRDQPPVLTLDATQLALRGEGASSELNRAQETELPVAATLAYVDAVAGYRVAAVESRRLVGLSRRDARADLPIVMAQAQAQAIADIWLQDVWAGRETARFDLPPSRLALEPGDAINLAKDGRTHVLRLSEISDGLQRGMTARSIERSIYRAGPVAARVTALAVPPVFGTPEVAFLDIPAVRAEDDPAQAAVAAFADPWPGSIALLRSRSGDSFEPLRPIDAAATLGTIQTMLDAGVAWRWDLANRVRVRLSGGALSSATRDAVLGGANLAAVRHVSGQWELLQFAGASLVGPDEYELSDLLRGQFGTDAPSEDPVAPGAAFVLIDGAVERMATSPEDIGVPFIYRFGPAGRDIADPAFGERTETLSGRGLLPLSPVHLRAARLGGDVELTWVRRTRTGGDAWEAVEVPLGETIEAYEVDILDGVGVKRTLASAQPRVLYASADMAADWGGPVSTLSFAVYQISATRGRGAARKVTLNV